MSNTVQLQFMPQRTAVPDQGGTLDVVVRVQAPTQVGMVANAARLPLSVTMVIDRSASMIGPPMIETLRCAEHIINRMCPEDEVAVVAYDDKIETVIPMTPVKDVGPHIERLMKLKPRGRTALHAAWQAGLAQLGAERPDRLTRVLLMSDGLANVGPRYLPEFAEAAQQARARGLSTTTIGLGSDFNEELMIGLANLCGGQSYFGQRAEDLFDSFGEELDLLQHLRVRNLRLQLTPGRGVRLEILSDLPTEDGKLLLSDLASGAERVAVVRLHMDPATPDQYQRELLKASIEGTASPGIVIDTSEQVLSLPSWQPSDMGELADNPIVLERSAEVRFARLLLDLRAAMKRRDEPQIQAISIEARRIAKGYPWLEAKLDEGLSIYQKDREMAAKELSYSSRRLHSRQIAHHEFDDCFVCPAPPPRTRQHSDAVLAIFGEEPSKANENETEVPSFLRRKIAEGKGGASS